MRALVLGGTGAMGAHVCRLLADAGHDVHVTTRSTRVAADGLSYIVGDAKDPVFLASLLAKGWDAIVDFMIWSTSEFSTRAEGFLGSAGQYVFLSSYRVYADSPVITETSPRLLDVVDDSEYLATDEYALAKARCEDILTQCGRNNWTVVRPAITYDGSVGRMQLAVHEASEWLWRAQRGIPVPLPAGMLGKQATMTWGGDVAQMIAGLVGNPAALGEAFTVSGSDHMAWREVAEVYAEVVPLEIAPCDLGRFERARGGVYQIRYDRMFDRVIDNSKVLSATGLQQGDFLPMRDGLARELRVCLDGDLLSAPSVGFNARMDRAFGGMRSFGKLLEDAEGGRLVNAAKYFVRRFI